MLRGHSFSFGSVCAVLVLLFVPDYLSAATPLFKPAQSYGAGGYPARSVAVADINGDGKPDIIVANGCTGCGSGPNFGVAVLLGTGGGGFGTAQDYSLNNQAAVSVAVGDVNGDGKQDILVTTDCFSTTHCDTGGVWVLLGDGHGNFQTPVVYNSGGVGASGIAVADFNGDGKLDVAVANCAATGSATCSSGIGTLAVLLGNGDGTFQSAKTFAAGGMHSWDIAAGDVNGDNNIDIVITNCAAIGSACESAGVDSVVGVLLGNGDGTFQPAKTYDSGGGATGGLALADLNADGKLDVVVTNGKVAVLLGNGDGSFQAAIGYDPGGSGADAVVVADVNHDGRPDLLVANYFCGSTYNCSHGSIGVLLGNGDGTFQHAVSYASGGDGAFRLAIADLNGDFKPDVIVANTFTTGGENSTGVVGVLMGTVGFETSSNIQSSLNPSTYGQTVSWTATVTSSGSITPTGKVNFTWGIYTIGAAILNGSGVATFSKSNLNADAYPLTAVYVGDAVNQGSKSVELNQLILETTSSATLTSSPNPTKQGQAVTFTAKISSPTVTPTGAVTFTAGKIVLGTAQLIRGKATMIISSLAVGLTKVTATYYGDSNIAKSSASVIQTVQ
ncbi:MAG TPA: FG-GAP-like repeat-containing protein [Candidatus Acidoferrales bacterium]|jgi:hypothetical protein|nr:FG-GAP-like repeat-containing protein [Candidatus Acidoferrales bacterium]